MPSLVTTSISGTNLNLDILADQNGTATITVIAEDSTGQTVSDDFLLTVTAVNDEPELIGTLLPSAGSHR